MAEAVVDPGSGGVLDAFGLRGKVALVTGAGSGLGAVTAGLFVAAGASVILADIDPAAARQVAGDCGAAGKAFAVEMDVADEASVRAGFEAAEQRWGGVDVLVNNAAYRGKAETMTMSVEEWDRMHAVIGRGTFLCLRAAAAQMRRKAGGSIVNISSVSAARPTILPNMHYDAAKAGVDAITRLAAVEFAGDRIRVNSVQPGGMNTKGATNIKAKPATGGAGNMVGPWAIAGRLPLARIAEPIEVARVVLFLASDASSYVTGTAIRADGGFSVG